MSETRETANAAIHQVILRLVENIASGRAEEIRSFSHKNSRCEFLCEKEKTYHAAAGESGFHQVKCPV